MTTFTDDFNRADGAIGSNWTTTSGAGTPQIASNAIALVAAAGEDCSRTAETFAADQEHYVTVIGGGGEWYAWVSVRCKTDGSQYIEVVWDHTGAFALSKNIGAGDVAVSSTTVGATSGSHTVGIKVVGDQVTCYFDGVATIGPTTVTGTFTGGAPGFGGYLVNTTCGFDDSSGGDVGGGTPTGTVAATLGSFTSAASGFTTVTGTSATTLASFTSSATGTAPQGYKTSNYATLNLDTLLVYDHGVQARVVNAGGESFYLIAAPVATVTGTSATTMDAFTSSASGSAGTTVTGTSATTMAAFTSTASGSSVTGSSAQTLAAFTSAASGAFGTDYVYDDFTGSAIDASKWVVYNRLGDQNNNEVNAVIPANVRVSSGNLLIDQKFEDVSAGDTTTGAPNPRTVHYTSGQINQRAGSFLYGSVRVRAKMPGGTGLWPCIWMLGYEWQPSQQFTANVAGYDWPNGGWWEVDIAEFINNHRSQVNNALHFITGNRGGSGEKTLPFDATTRFMVYRLDWTPTSMTWSVDAEDGNGFVQTLQITGTAGTDIPNTPAFLVIHCAIGGNAVGDPDSATFPQTMSVDYAQVQRTSDSIDQPMGYVYTTDLGAFTSSASGTAGTTVTGTSATTLAAFTSSAAGATGPSGTSAQTLAAFTSSAAGSSTVGSLAATLSAFVSTASGAAGGAAGTVAATLDAFTSSASGSTVAGASATTMAPFTSSASGGSGAGGSVNITLDAFVISASGSIGASGSSATTLAAFTSTAAGSSVVGSSATTMSAFVGLASGSFGSDVDGSVNATLDAFIGSATGVVLVTGATAATLGVFTASASGATGPSGTSATTLAAFIGSGSGSSVVGSSAQTLAAFTSSATGSHSISGTSATTMGAFTSAAAGSSVAGTSATTLAAFVSSASGTHSISGTVAVTLDAFTGTASGQVVTDVEGTVDVTLDLFAAIAAGSSTTGSVAAIIGAFLAVASGTVPMPGGTFVGWGMPA